MATLGSVTNPSFAGWIEHGAGWQFACQYRTPSFDIYVTSMSCYFDTYQGNGAVGKMVIWSSGGSYSPLAILAGGTINNGTLSAGGQQWWNQSLTTPIIIPASTQIWIGCWCNQNIVVSTYDTSPPTWAMNSGSTSNPTNFSGATSSGQGPLGCYITYSQIVKGSMSTEGGSGGLQATGRTNIPGTQGILGSLGGGLAPVNTQNLGNLTANMGGSGGLYIAGEVLNVPQIRIWR